MPTTGIAATLVGMAAEPTKILLTGPPRCGKTTAVMKIVAALRDVDVAGFYTEEIRESGKRKGFRWKLLDGASGTLAHVCIKGPHRVGRYGVDIATFDHEVVPALDTGQCDAELFVIDEIGKMECLSPFFARAVTQLFESDRSVLATVALKGPDLIAQVKRDPAIRLIHMTAENRDELTRQITKKLGAAF